MIVFFMCFNILKVSKLIVFFRENRFIGKLCYIIFVIFYERFGVGWMLMFYKVMKLLLL